MRINQNQKDTGIYWMKKLLVDYSKFFIEETDTLAFFSAKDSAIQIRIRDEEETANYNNVYIYEDYITGQDLLSDTDSDYISEVKDYNIRVTFRKDNPALDVNGYNNEYLANLYLENLFFILKESNPHNYNFAQVTIKTSKRVLGLDNDGNQIHDCTFRMFFKKKKETEINP